jgi:hypothetical protein
MIASVRSILLNGWIISQHLVVRRRLYCALSSLEAFDFIMFMVITESQENTSTSPCDTRKDCTSLESEIWADCTHVEEKLDKGLQNIRI